jgi:hypothetical protein
MNKDPKCRTNLVFNINQLIKLEESSPQRYRKSSIGYNFDSTEKTTILKKETNIDQV